MVAIVIHQEVSWPYRSWHWAGQIAEHTKTLVLRA